jgi:hypothetical protein
MRVGLALVVSALAACRTASVAPTTAAPPVTAEQPVRLLPLRGAILEGNTEISGMAWYGDTLVLLPQYPERCGNALFALDRADIVAFLDGRRLEPLEPRTIAFHADGAREVPGYEGFEAIAFAGGRAYVTLETSASGMLGYVAAGEMQTDGRLLRVDVAGRKPLAPGAALRNMSDEALFVAGDRVVTLFEANGARVNPRPVAHVFDLELEPQGTVPVAPMEYRITDATPPDAAGRFWVLNSYWVGDARLGLGLDRSVEQLVELEWKGDRITRTRRPPIALVRLGDRVTRNWEAIARLDAGFLVATDTYPETLLGWVPAPRID